MQSKAYTMETKSCKSHGRMTQQGSLRDEIAHLQEYWNHGKLFTSWGDTQPTMNVFNINATQNGKASDTFYKPKKLVQRNEMLRYN